MILDKAYWCLKKKTESFWVETNSLIPAVHNYQDERCTGTNGCKNKYIRQNIINRSWLVVEVS